ncbi:MAG: hypothetical protein ACTSO7_18815, partial [Candidatus Heimdallarchaeota archaeon]
MESGIYAFCSECGEPINRVFEHEGELRKFILENPKCQRENCGVQFSFLDDGRIWNLRHKILPSKEEY